MIREYRCALISLLQFTDRTSIHPPFQRVEFLEYRQDKRYNDMELSQRVVLASSEDNLFVAFRGTDTDNPNDIVADLMIDLIPSNDFPSDMLFHEGFLKLTQLCLRNNGSDSDLMSRIKNWNPANPPKVSIQKDFFLFSLVIMSLI